MINENVYSEVYELLSYMDKKTVMMIPFEILELIKQKRNTSYISKIDKKDIFNPANVQEDTISFIAWLDLNYWANEEEKKILMERYRRNEIELEKEKKEKYSQIFPDKNNSLKQVEEYTIPQEMQLEIKKESIFSKIKEFIRNLF